VVHDARLRELDLGGWQGLTAAQARERFPDEHAAWRSGVDVARGGGETYRQAGERASQCLLEHLPTVPEHGTLVAVTHGGTARATVGLLLELPVSTWGKLAPLDNAHWSVLLEHPSGWRLEQHGVGPTLPVPAPVPEADGRPL
jgi:broad specificity phosphatase PhoE